MDQLLGGVQYENFLPSFHNNSTFLAQASPATAVSRLHITLSWLILSLDLSAFQHWLYNCTVYASIINVNNWHTITNAQVLCPDPICLSVFSFPALRTNSLLIWSWQKKYLLFFINRKLVYPICETVVLKSLLGGFSSRSFWSTLSLSHCQL